MVAGAVGVLVLVVVAVLVGTRLLGDGSGTDGASGATTPSASAETSGSPASPAATPGATAAPTDGGSAAPSDQPGASTTPSAAATPDASGGPTPGPVPTEAPSTAVDDLVTELAQVLASVRPAPTGEDGQESQELDLGALDEHAVGAALGEAQAQVAEYQDQGWRQVGTPRVVWVRGQRALDAAGTTVRVRACLDSTDVRVVDAAGRDVPGSAGSRSVNLLDLVAVDGTWKVSARSFPDQADC